MKTRIEIKLLNIISQFVGMTLQNARFVEKNINGENVIILELMFLNENKPQIMVIALNDKLTTNNFKEIYFELVEERQNQYKNNDRPVRPMVQDIIAESSIVDKIKWQIHAKTCLTQIMLWIIVMKLFGGWFILIIGSLSIIGNMITLIWSVIKLGKNYFK